MMLAKQSESCEKALYVARSMPLPCRYYTGEDKEQTLLVLSLYYSQCILIFRWAELIVS